MRVNKKACLNGEYIPGMVKYKDFLVCAIVVDLP